MIDNNHQTKAMTFKDWKFNSCTTEDGERWHWAEYYFTDSKGDLVGKSPVYVEGASDFHCLAQDAPQIAFRLREGASWEEVCGQFRQAW